MRTIFLVVGESDIGVNTTLVKGERYLPVRRAGVSTWAGTLPTIEDPQVLVDYVKQPRQFDEAGSLVDHTGAGDPARRAIPPLVSLLSSVEATDEVDLILIGTRNPDGVATAEIADGYDKLLTAHPTLFGPSTTVRTLTAERFDMDEVAELVRTELDEEDAAEATPVEISWGSGATELELAVMSGVIASGRRWLLRQPRSPFRIIDLRSRLPYPAAVSWFLRYGYPSRVPAALGPARSAHPDILAVADSATQSLTLVANGSTDPADLAAWVRTDARRRSRTAGLAVRAWITAEYRRRCRIDGSPDVLSFLERKRVVRDGVEREVPRQLGEILSMLTSAKAHGPVLRSKESESGQWLAHVEDLADAGKASSHEFEPLTPTSLDELDRALERAGEFGEMVDCGPFPMPSGVVAYLWVEGRTSSGRDSALDTVLTSPPAQELLEVVPPTTTDGPRHTVADLLILSTARVRPFADEQREQAVDRSRTLPQGYLFRSASVREVEFSGITDHPIADPEGLAHGAAQKWLDERDVDAIVVVPTGNKSQLAGVVSAALTYGHRRAVPVFLQSSNTETRETRFHRVLPYLVTNTPVLELARAALRTMAFDTAGVLVSLCHPHGRVVSADELLTIRTSLDTLNREFFDRAPRNARNRLLLLSQRLVDGASLVDQIRCAHVAAEIYSASYRALERRRGKSGGRLIDVRDSLAVNHRADGLRTALDRAGASLGVEELKLGPLIRWSAAELPPDREGTDLVGLFDRIDDALKTAIRAARAAANQPIDVLEFAAPS